MAMVNSVMTLHGAPTPQLLCTALPISTMKVDKVLHMEGGQGAHSYAHNSFLQRRIISKTRRVLAESIKEMCARMEPEILTIADLGCSSGPNALEGIWEIINVSANIYRSKDVGVPQLNVFLNDLVGNDFNTLFRTTFPDFQKKLEKAKIGPCSLSGTPGSFYGRLFPNNFLHLVHASSSVHFLSEVPLINDGATINKGAICITKKSPPKVHEAYYQRFAKDFTMFLTSRAMEIVPGGAMILTFRISTKSDAPDYIWDFELLGEALQNMVLEGRIKEEKLDSFDMPLYTPSVEEVLRLVKAQGSFAINQFETFVVDWGLKDTDLNLTVNTRAKHVSDGYRAATGPILGNQFGTNLMDDLFLQFEEMAKERLETGRLELLNIVVSMTRK